MVARLAFVHRLRHFHHLDRRRRPALAAALLLSIAAMPAALHAAVTVVYNCPSSGSGGNHDSVFNGFYVQDVNAVNLHSVVINYTTDTDGMYDLSLTATTGSFGGPHVGTTQSQNVFLSSSTDTPVTWNFGDAAFTPGNTIFFVHNASGSGGVSYNLQPTLCPGDEETVGVSTTPNGISVAVAITDNPQTTSQGCVANNQTLCIDDLPGDKRFQIGLTFATTQGGGQSGNGQAISLTPVGVTEGGLFWFFAANNPEMLIKIINGCSLNQHFWVFYSAGTNVGFKVTVKDTKTQHVATYTNPDQTAAAPEQDTSALACP